MVLSSLSKREKYILFFTVVVVLSSLLYSFILEPLAKRWRELSQQIVAREMRLKKNLKTISERERVQTEYAKYADYAKPEGSDEEEIALVLAEVEKLARSSNVHITDIKPQQIKDTGTYKKYLIDVEVEAGIDQLSQFIYELQKSSHLLKTEKLQVTTKTNQPSILKSHMLITKILIP